MTLINWWLVDAWGGVKVRVMAGVIVSYAMVTGKLWYCHIWYAWVEFGDLSHMHWWRTFRKGSFVIK